MSLHDPQQRAARNLWAGVAVQCGACSWEGSRGDFLEHGRECGDCEVKCRLKGCSWKGPRRELEEHTADCDFREVYCKECRATYRWHERSAHEQVVKRCELERRLTAVRYEFSLRLQEQQAEFDRRMKEQADEFDRRFRAGARKGKGRGSPKGFKARSSSMTDVDMEIVGVDAPTPSTMWRWDAPTSPPFQC